MASGRRRTALFALSLPFVACREPAAPPGVAVLYARYCAACHGREGRGDGPVAPVLYPPPPDLTKVVSTVPEVMRAIDGRRPIAAHGAPANPVWGRSFEESLADDPHTLRTAATKTQALAEHVVAFSRRAP
jgi:mono/diheme cytochrome c family protein